MKTRSSKHKSRKHRSHYHSHSDDEWSDEEEHEIEKKVNTVGTSIYFYSDVTEESTTNLTKQLYKLEIKLMKKAVELPGYKPEINVYIRSEGGDVYAGFSAMDELKNSRVVVNTIVDGMCASAATIIYMGGHNRYIKPHAHMLIHQITVNGFWGTFEDLKDETDNCEKIMNMLKKVYSDNCKIPKKVFKELMQKDVLLSPSECLEYGIAHETVCRGTA